MSGQCQTGLPIRALETTKSRPKYVWVWASIMMAIEEKEEELERVSLDAWPRGHLNNDTESTYERHLIVAE